MTCVKINSVYTNDDDFTSPRNDSLYCNLPDKDSYKNGEYLNAC